MNIYQANYFCDLNDPKETMDLAYFGEVSLDQVKKLFYKCMEVYGYVEDPTGLLTEQNFDKLTDQSESKLLMYCEDVHKNFCRQFLIICSDDIEEAEDFADLESWNHILDLTDAYEDLVLAEPEDEP